MDLPTRSFRDGVSLDLGPFTVKVSSDDRAFINTFRECYATLEPAAPETVAHFRVALRRRRRLGGLRRHQVAFSIEGTHPFEPYPGYQGFPMFEWGLNWCIATGAHRYLLFHCAAVERRGHALLMPAMPGSGKSTLAACLLGAGWRLLSDEFGILDYRSGQILPMPRAIPLKNRSIPVFRERETGLSMGPTYPKTRKGEVCHVFPPAESLRRQAEGAPPALIVFPRYEAGSDLDIRPVPPHIAFTRLTNNAFNYRVCARAGFEAATALAQSTPAYAMQYSDVDKAMARIDELLDEALS
jgi:HprK-related kinase A